MTFGPVVQEEISFKEKVYGWTDDGQSQKNQLTLSLRLRCVKNRDSVIYRGGYLSAHVMLNLLNELGIPHLGLSYFAL